MSVTKIDGKKLYNKNSWRKTQSKESRSGRKSIAIKYME